MPAPDYQVRREDRLGDETAPYRLILEEELPAAWMQPPGEAYMAEMALRLGVQREDLYSHVCVELPDYGWARHYERWAREAAPVASAAGCRPLLIMVTAQSDYRNLPTADERLRLATECLRSLAIHGKPLPLFCRAFGAAPGN